MKNEIFNSANSNIDKKSRLEAIRLNHEGLKSSVLGNRKKAIELFNKSIENDDQFAEPYCNIGNIFLQKGDNKEALELYLKAFVNSILI